MLDDWFSSLMVLVSEKDVLEHIAIDRIIAKFATLHSLNTTADTLNN